MKCKFCRGYASELDNQCKFCREANFSRTEAKSVGVRHRGDGMSLEQRQKLLLKKAGW